MTEMPKIVKISKIIDESSDIKTFIVEEEIDYKPGQFIMVWIPDVDEKPYSVSEITEKHFAITVEKKGGFSEAFHNLKVGDKIGYRGPYGNGFDFSDKKISGKKVCVIGGGCGIAPVFPLIKSLENPTVILGCQTHEKMIFKEKVSDFHLCTDDGTFGHEGFVTEKFLELLDNGELFDIVFTCGPEPMMKAVFDICEEKGIECQASLERFMICGIGICSQCMCDNKRVCKDGPVFLSTDLRELKDFGKKAMIKTGKKVPLKEFYEFKTEY